VKFAFSNLGSPLWTAEQTADQAARMGYNGVELRLLENEVIDPVRDKARIKEAVEIYRSRGLDVCAFDTSCKFNNPDAEERAQNVAALRTWIQLAQALQVPILRVFGGAGDGKDIAQENQWVADALREVAPQAEQAGVIITLETHDGFASAKRTAEVLEAVNSPAIAALWDSHHPYRMGETAEEVWQILGKRVAHVHVKDAVRDASDPTGWKLVLVGKGEVQVREQLQSLHAHGYTGYVSVEWEKRWHPEIEEPEIALPQHIAWLRDFEQSLS
jgi:fatty-acyl-CoA synthase